MFIALTTVCVSLACCFQCVFWMNTPVKKKFDARVLKVAAAENENYVVDTSHNLPFFQI